MSNDSGTRQVSELPPGWKLLAGGAAVKIDTGGGRLVGLPTPIEDTEVATKKYVDDNSGGEGGGSTPLIGTSYIWCVAVVQADIPFGTGFVQTFDPAQTTLLGADLALNADNKHIDILTTGFYMVVAQAGIDTQGMAPATAGDWDCSVFLDGSCPFLAGTDPQCRVPFPNSGLLDFVVTSPPVPMSAGDSVRLRGNTLTVGVDTPTYQTEADWITAVVRMA